MAGLLVVLAMLLTIAQWPSRITRANYDRIAAGMSEAEVEAILGPSNMTDAQAAKLFELEQKDPDITEAMFDVHASISEVWDDALQVTVEFNAAGATWRFWDSREGYLPVTFKRGRVMSKAWVPRRSLAQRLWRQFKHSSPDSP